MFDVPIGLIFEVTIDFIRTTLNINYNLKGRPSIRLVYDHLQLKLICYWKKFQSIVYIRFFFRNRSIFFVSQQND